MQCIVYVIVTFLLDKSEFPKFPKRKPKLSRHIKLNHTNTALLLQDATQKYRKLTDYRTKCCYLSLLFSLLIVICIPSPSSMAGYFQSLDTLLNITSDHLCCI